MSAQVLNGNAIAATIREEVGKRVDKLVQSCGVRPSLKLVLVGNDPASALYVRLKKRDCDEIGILCSVDTLPSDTTTDALIELIEQLNADENTHGILLQLPLPEHIDSTRVIEHIHPKKDVDGITPFNLGMLTLRQPAHRCCTPKGVMTLLKQTGVNLLGTNAVVVGASNHVGRPMSLELLMVGCTVTVCHQYSRDTKAHTRLADVLVTATGQAGMITEDWVKPGAVVIDVGIQPQADGTLMGDVEFEGVREKASWITPVPGGVGPMTRVSILQNLLEAVESVESVGT